MAVAVEKIVRRLNLSGFHGFDFMLETGSQDAYLIEINPRATQVGHLRLGSGRDLPAALQATVSGTVVQEDSKLTENPTITLFPQEWLRNPASPFLRSSYHDVPWEEPGLVRACLDLGSKRSVGHRQTTFAQLLSTGERVPSIMASAKRGGLDREVD
jgi:hypothetical protein